MFKAVVYEQAVQQDTIEIAKLRRSPTWFRWMEIDRDDVVKSRLIEKKETITVIESRDWLKEMLLDFEQTDSYTLSLDRSI